RTATITPFTLTVSGITADSRAYDNNTDATVHTGGASANFFAGDSDGTTLNVSGAVGTFSDKHQGVGKTVTISGLTLNNNSTFGDYALPTPQQTPPATITPFSLPARRTSDLSRAYDNNTDATVHTGSASANFFAGDSDGTTLNVSGAVGTFS